METLSIKTQLKLNQNSIKLKNLIVKRNFTLIRLTKKEIIINYTPFGINFNVIIIIDNENDEIKSEIKVNIYIYKYINMIN